MRPRVPNHIASLKHEQRPRAPQVHRGRRCARPFARAHVACCTYIHSFLLDVVRSPAEADALDLCTMRACRPHTTTICALIFAVALSHTPTTSVRFISFAGYVPPRALAASPDIRLRTIIPRYALRVVVLDFVTLLLRCRTRTPSVHCCQLTDVAVRVVSRRVVCRPVRHSCHATPPNSTLH